MVTFTPVLKRRVNFPPESRKKSSSIENVFLACAKPGKVQPRSYASHPKSSSSHVTFGMNQAKHSPSQVRFAQNQAKYSPVLTRFASTQPKSSPTQRRLSSAQAKSNPAQPRYGSYQPEPSKTQSKFGSKQSKPGVIAPPRPTGLCPKNWLDSPTKPEPEKKTFWGSLKSEKKTVPKDSADGKSKQGTAPWKKSSSIKLPALQPNKIFPKLFKGGRVSSPHFPPIVPPLHGYSGCQLLHVARFQVNMGMRLR